MPSPPRKTDVGMPLFNVRTCPWCLGPIHLPSRKVYCCRNCKQAAHSQRVQNRRLKPNLSRKHKSMRAVEALQAFARKEAERG